MSSAAEVSANEGSSPGTQVKEEVPDDGRGGSTAPVAGHFLADGATESGAMVRLPEEAPASLLSAHQWMDQCDFECRACEFRNRTVAAMESHCADEHGERARDEYEAATKVFLRCPECDVKILWTRSDIETHIGNDHEKGVEAYFQTHVKDISKQAAVFCNTAFEESAPSGIFVPSLMAPMPLSVSSTSNASPEKVVIARVPSASTIEALPMPTDQHPSPTLKAPQRTPKKTTTPSPLKGTPGEEDKKRERYGDKVNTVPGGPTKWYDQTLHECVFCGKRNYTMTIMKTHCRVEHGDSTAHRPALNVRYRCLICSKDLQCDRISIECHIRANPHKLTLRQYNDMFPLEQHEEAVTIRGSDSGGMATEKSPVKVSLLDEGEHNLSRTSELGRQKPMKSPSKPVDREGQSSSASSASSAPVMLSIMRRASNDGHQFEDDAPMPDSPMTPPRTPSSSSSASNSQPQPRGGPDMSWVEKCQFRCKDCFMTVGKRAQIQAHISRSESCSQKSFDVSLQTYHTCFVCNDEVLNEGASLRAHMQKHNLKLQAYAKNYLRDEEPPCPPVVASVPRLQPSASSTNSGSSKKRRRVSSAMSSGGDENWNDGGLSQPSRNSLNGKPVEKIRLLKRGSAPTPSKWYNRPGRAATHKCKLCTRTIRLDAVTVAGHFRSAHGVNLDDYTTYFMQYEDGATGDDLTECPVCESFLPRGTVEQHAVDVHRMTKEKLQRFF